MAVVREKGECILLNENGDFHLAFELSFEKINNLYVFYPGYSYPHGLFITLHKDGKTGIFNLQGKLLAPLFNKEDRKTPLQALSSLPSALSKL